MMTLTDLRDTAEPSGTTQCEALPVWWGNASGRNAASPADPE